MTGTVRVVQVAFSSHKHLICLGGDHSVTLPVLRAAAKHHPDLSVLHLDAHPDLYETLPRADNGVENRLSHGSPFLRALEEGLIQRLVQVLDSHPCAPTVVICCHGESTHCVSYVVSPRWVSAR